MRTDKLYKISCFLFLLIFKSTTMYAYEVFHYPLKIEKIEKVQSNYNNPENTIFSLRSSLLQNNIQWADETMTSESLEEIILIFQKAGIDREASLIDLEKNIKTSFILDKIIYKDVKILVIEARTYSGSIKYIPVTLMNEDGLWKITNKYKQDEKIHEIFYYVPPLFYGKGGRPMDVNTFLGYEQPTKAQTILADGDKSYVVHVYYGRTIDPSTFTAELNRENVSDLFSPEPLTDEEVEIPLQRGRNTLILSVEGTRNDGKKASDTDRLVFIVP